MKKSELKAIIFETLCEYYQDTYRRALLKEDKSRDMVFAEGETLPNNTDIMLGKFPTLKHALQRLMTDQFTEFISGIDWISPKPTEFRINLKNGQNFLLKWMGKDFEANVSGKSYYIGQLADFQQALNKLAILYQEGPMGEEEPEQNSAGGPDTDSSFTGGGSGGDFPGGGPSGSEPESSADGEEESSAEGGEEGKDMGSQEIDFESDSDI